MQKELQNTFIVKQIRRSNTRMAIANVLLLFIPPVSALFPIWIWNLIKTVRRSYQPRRHPIAQKIGDPRDFAQIVQEIETELSHPQTQKLGSAYVTPNWVFQKQLLTLEVMRMQDVVWFYPGVLNVYRYGMLSRSHHSVTVADRWGRSAKISLRNQHQVAAALEWLAVCAPWAMAGYGKDIKKQWQWQRRKLIEQVDQRRAQLSSRLPE